MSQNYVRHPTLKVGDHLRCLKSRFFIDGTRHNKEDILLVEEETLNYYQLFTPELYEVVRL